MQTVLFLCTGNYFRSRFAEMLFNFRAAEKGLEWRAVSRGLALELGSNNVGPISTYVLDALQRRAIPIPAELRYPEQATDGDFESADMVVALKGVEHKPYVQKRHPAWVDKTVYWDVTDMIPTADYDPLAVVEEGVIDLIEELLVEAGHFPKQRSHTDNADNADFHG